MKEMGIRAQAASILVRLVEGKGSLTNLLATYRDGPDFSLLQEMCFGVCRWYYQLDGLLQRFLSKPLKSKDQDIRALLLLGLYQLRELSLPDHAVLNETVTAASPLGKPWAKALVNAVLRNYLRQQDVDLKELSEPARFAHPAWLLKRLQQDWPQHWQELVTHNNLRPPMTLRVNLARGSRNQYLQKLHATGIKAQPGALAPSCLYLEKAAPVTSLPGFAEGLVSVQDEASQLVAGLLKLAPGQRVLDACAAPGGKTCHILESERSLLELLALDEDPQRLERLKENLQRGGFHATIGSADVGKPEQWWDRRPFDRILLDAPCSATGVIRRHPDIKLLRHQQDIPRLASQQSRLLQTLWSCLKPGGRLLYTTCSVLRQENEAVLTRFMNSVEDAKYERITADWGVECHYGRQLLTGSRNGPDGFFYALLQKSQVTDR